MQFLFHALVAFIIIVVVVVIIIILISFFSFVWERRKKKMIDVRFFLSFGYTIILSEIYSPYLFFLS